MLTSEHQDRIRELSAKTSLSKIAKTLGLPFQEVKDFVSSSKLQCARQELPKYEYIQECREYKIVFFAEVPGYFPGMGYTTHAETVQTCIAPSAIAALGQYLSQLPQDHSHVILFNKQGSKQYKGKSRIEALPVGKLSIGNFKEGVGLTTDMNEESPKTRIIRNYCGSSIEISLEQWEKERSDLSEVKKHYFGALSN